MRIASYSVKHHQPLNVSSSCMVIWGPIHTGHVSPGDLVWISPCLCVLRCIHTVQAKTVSYSHSLIKSSTFRSFVTSTFRKRSCRSLAATAYHLKLFKVNKKMLCGCRWIWQPSDAPNLLRHHCPLSHQAAVRVRLLGVKTSPGVKCETNR